MELKPNAELIRKEIEWAEGHPEEWKQDGWAEETDCGTTCCIAGHTVLDAGYQLDWDNGRAATTGGRRIKMVAAELLGLTEDQAGLLFWGTNDIGTLYRVASQLTNGEVEVPVQHERPGEKYFWTYGLASPLDHKGAGHTRLMT